MKAECNKCGKQSPMKPRVSRQRNKIEKHYFRCIHCNHEYLIAYTDEDIRQKQKKIRKLISKNKQTGLYEDRVANLKKEIESDMATLRERLG